MSSKSIVRAAALVAVVAVGIGVWFAFFRDRTYPHEYPGSSPDMSMERALSEHRVHLPEDASGIGYAAFDLPEGSVLRMDFVVPCGGVPSVLVGNGLHAVADELAMSDGSVTWQAEDRGWKRGKDDIFAERPTGSASGDLEGVVAHEGDDRCHVYLNAHG